MTKTHRMLKCSFLFTLPLLALLAVTACYRATGYERTPLVALVIPAEGGDRVPGLKSMAGAGDYYLGNDFVALAVDGTPPGETVGIAGAPGAGSIVDVGYIDLDTSYRRVPMPCDMLDRLTTVINQDPDISLVFNEILPINGAELARLEMHGMIHDPKHKLRGVSWDNKGFVQDVSAVSNISLGILDRSFIIETTITNKSSAAIDVRNIGDFLYQRGGGFRVLATVNEDKSGNPLSTWGVDMPGTDFSSPLDTSVRSGLIVFMGTEPGADTMDCHVSLGLMPLDSEQFLVASDPQNSLRESRPIFPERFVAGSLDTGVSLAPGASLAHNRRLFVKGGSSGMMDYNHYLIIFTQNTPNQATGLLNDMYRRLSSMSDTPPILFFAVEGSGQRSGPIPSELRFEKYTGNGNPETDREQANWKLERLEWFEPPETFEMSDVSSSLTPTALTPMSNFGIYLPEGTYRIVFRNRLHSTILQKGTNINNGDRPNLEAPITLADGNIFMLGENLSPERSEIYSPSGVLVSQAQNAYYVITRSNDSEAGFVQPVRLAILAQESSSTPDLRRRRSITSTYDANTKTPRPPWRPIELPPGPFHFVGGNTAFGVQMVGIDTALTVWTSPGLYDVYGARGPLSTLETFTLDSRPGMSSSGKNLTIFATPSPKGWVSFDTPGPSMATSGGMLPCEQLASALTEGVNVVARTETDHQTDADALHREFHNSLLYSHEFKAALLRDPVTGAPPSDLAVEKSIPYYDPMIISARSSNLGEFGIATAYFVPADVNARNGGARPSRGWSLADFLTQAEGKYNVIHRPRGPEGLFTRMGFSPTLPIMQAAPWWNQTGNLSMGKTNGEFDAIEIMNAETIASSGINVWWSEFRSVRDDWFSLLNQQTPNAFTKALGFSGGKYSQDTPVGMVRTWLNIGEASLTQPEPDPILRALKEGAAVVSSGPMLDVKVGETGPGGFAAIGGTPSTVILNVTLIAPDWVPVDELRVVVNGQAVLTMEEPKAKLTRSTTDSRYYTGTLSVSVPTGKDAWLVVEAGAPLSMTGPYAPSWRAWNALMKGIYPVALTNPIFLGLRGGNYIPPGI